MELGSQFSISAYETWFSVLHFSLWSLVLGSPARVMKLGSQFSISGYGAVGSQFSISAYGTGFLVLHLEL